jgi:FkbM family methyltransferase
MRKILKLFQKQYIKLKRDRWERFQNNGKHFLVFNYKNLFKIRLYKDSFISEEIYKSKFEPEESEFIRDFLKEGDIFIDIGANIGLYTLMAARKIGALGKVYSFEPTTTTYARLLENININRFRNIIPVNKALSDKNGMFEINVSCDGFEAWNSFSKITRGSKFGTEIVEATRFDSFFNDDEIRERISLIKIDVEGWEKFVLLGGEEYFKKFNSPVLIVEFVDQNTINAGYTCKELYFQLKGYGYEIYNLQNNKIQEEFPKDYYEYSNLIATKDINMLIQRLNNWTFQ